MPETVVLCGHTLCPSACTGSELKLCLKLVVNLACSGLKLGEAQDMRAVKEGVKVVLERKKQERATLRPAAKVDEKQSRVETTAIMFSHMSKRGGV